MSHERELLAVLTRLVVVLERMSPPPVAQTPIDPGASPDLLPIDQGPTPVKKPTGTSVTVIRRNYLQTDEPEMDERGLTSGGRIPEDFWNEKDPYPREKRDRMKPKKMGRRFE